MQLRKLHFKDFFPYLGKAIVKGIVEWLMRLSTFQTILTATFLLRLNHHLAVMTFLVIVATVLLEIPKECARSTSRLLQTLKSKVSYNEKRLIVHSSFVTFTLLSLIIFLILILLKSSILALPVVDEPQY